MSYEEFEEEYFKNRPVEPLQKYVSPDLWAALVTYAEFHLKRAYEKGWDDAMKKISVEKGKEVFPLREEIRKIVCEHLSLKENCEPYSGMYAELCWDDTELGSVCLRGFGDD